MHSPVPRSSAEVTTHDIKALQAPPTPGPHGGRCAPVFRFSLHPGHYVLVGEAGAVLAEVDVPAAGAEVRLE